MPSNLSSTLLAKRSDTRLLLPSRPLIAKVPRSPMNGNARDGSVAIPKLRTGTYFPDWLLERRRRPRRP